MTDMNQLIAQSGITDPESLDLVRAELEKSLGDSIDSAIYKGQRDQEDRRKKSEVDAQVKDLTAELEGLQDGTHGSMSKLENVKRRKEIAAELDKLSPPVETRW